MIKTNCVFPITNENIYAIREGLKPNKNDNIYSICGGGDIPFMLVENGAKVFAVDYDSDQISFIKKRLQNLRNTSKGRNFKTFRSLSNDLFDSEDYENAPNISFRDNYFSQIEVESIIKNLENLTVQEGNFFNMKLDFSNFNKVYTSNAPLYREQNFEMMPDFVSKFRKKTRFCLTYSYSSYSRRILDEFFEKDLVQEDAALSKKLSSQDDRWNVSVFFKK